MNINTARKLTTTDLFDGIWFDYFYLTTNTTGQIYWIASQDIQYQPYLITCLELAEKLVESVAKSAELPFIFDKSLEGTRLIKKNRLGELLYELIAKQNVRPESPNSVEIPFRFSVPFKIENFDRAQYRYEVSENLKILHTVASDLKFNCLNFTGNPISEIIPGLLEGELINSLVIRLREATKRKSFKTNATVRKKDSTQSFTKTKRYIERLFDNNPYSYSIRMFMYYQNDHANSITLEESDKHLMQFLKLLEDVLEQGNILGWWWKREYMTELGYRYHLIIFLDQKIIPYNPNLIRDFGYKWDSITGQRGAYYIPFVPEWDYQQCEYGFYQQEARDNVPSLLLSINRMLMRDVYMRLHLNQRFNHFGMGPLPKLANNGLTNNRFMQGNSSGY